jgi:hypothetical protein
VVTEERRGGLVWVDARGLDAEVIARASLEVLRGLGLSNVHAGIGSTPIVAEVHAITGDRGPGAGGRGDDLDCAVSPVPGPRCPVPGILPPSILEPNDTLAALLDGIGIETCAERAALEGESVEVRLGADGVRLWKLARGEDDRRIFAPIPRSRPHASLEWSDYALTDTERLLFSVNALLGTVCETLVERGSLAREMALELKLASSDALTTPIRAGRPTASRKTWLRLARGVLERMVLPAGVVGLTLIAATVVTDEGNQGDLFDRGFATAAATEAALASLAEEQGDVVVIPENSAHPLVERRTTWVGQQDPMPVKRPRKKRPPRPPARVRELPNDSPPPPAAPDAEGTFPAPSLLTDAPAPDSRLTLYLLPTPRTIETHTEERRDHMMPTAYRDGGAWYKVLSSAGPDRVSGERWGEAYAREYFRCIVDDGGMVWLYRDGKTDGWFIHGWWD